MREEYLKSEEDRILKGIGWGIATGVLAGGIGYGAYGASRYFGKTKRARSYAPQYPGVQSRSAIISSIGGSPIDFNYLKDRINVDTKRYTY